MWIGHLPSKVRVGGALHSFPFDSVYVRPARELFGCEAGYLAELDVGDEQQADLYKPPTTFGWLEFRAPEAAQRCAAWVCATPQQVAQGVVLPPPHPHSVKVGPGGETRENGLGPLMAPCFNYYCLGLGTIYTG